MRQFFKETCHTAVNSHVKWMKKEPKIEKLPAAPAEITKGDIAHRAAKAAAGLVPFAGTAISEVLDHTVRAPAEKRMNNWLVLVEETVNRLIEEIEGLTPQGLSQNDAFTTAVISTTRSAMLTERQDKFEVLQSVIHTAGSGFVLDEVLRNTFFATIDRYTPEHVLLLYRCSNSEVLEEAFSRYKSSKLAEIGVDEGHKDAQIELIVPWILTEVDADVATELFSDLHRDRFCRGSEGFAFTFGPNEKLAVSTPRGSEFLRFIFGPLGAPANGNTDTVGNAEKQNM